MPDGGARPDISVRLAQLADEQRLYDFLLGLDADNNFGVAMSPDKVWQHIRAGTRGGGGLIGIIEVDGNIVASVGLFLSQLWFTDEWSLYERWLFVNPEYRELGLAEKLFAWMEEQRQKAESTAGQRFLLFTGCTSLKRTKIKMKFWEKFSRPIGGFYVMGLK